MTGVKEVKVAYNYTMVLKMDNTLWVMGANVYGQFGDGTTVGKSTPIQVMTGVKTMAIATRHALILKLDNTLWGMGDNYFGELGDGTFQNNLPKTVPVQIMTNVKIIAAGSNYSIAVKADNSFWVSGQNNGGQFGNGTILPLNTFTQVNIP
jgi:alpha-tubulin suppressor-like RCC1 family protein